LTNALTGTSVAPCLETTVQESHLPTESDEVQHRRYSLRGSKYTA